MKKQIIIKTLEELGFDLIGFAKPDFELLKNRLEEADKLGYSNPLIKGEIAERIDPKLIFDKYQSAIVVGITYTKDSEVIDRNLPHFGNSSWGTDYHTVIKNLLNQFVSIIKKQIPEFLGEIIVDTSFMDDRFLAYSAGLGFYGKNGLVINPTLGSYFFIGTVLTNLDLEGDGVLSNNCGTCNKCMIACPTKAINDSGYLDSFKCRSYLTQKKEDLTDTEIMQLDTSIFGCDVCARVCPYNKVNHQKNSCFLPTGIEQINNELELSNQEFKKLFGHLAGAYIGLKRIKRNTKYIKDKKNML